jgi:hypothetical protein
MYFALFGGLHTSESYASGLAAWIKFERDGLQLALFEAPILQPNTERFQTMDNCSFAR